MEKVKQCCNKEYLKENCPCIKTERQRIKEEIEKLDDVRAEWNGVEWIPKHKVLALLEGEK